MEGPGGYWNTDYIVFPMTRRARKIEQWWSNQNPHKVERNSGL